MKLIDEKDPQSLEKAVNVINNGGLISLNCDTVYGIAADAKSHTATQKIYDIKGRSSLKPLVIFLPNISTAKEIFYFNEIAEKIAQEFLPGNLTMILKTKNNIDKNLIRNLNVKATNSGDFYIGFRIIENSFMRNLLEKAGKILAVTSANPSGKESATTAQQLYDYFTNNEIALVINNGESDDQIASTIVKISDDKVEILRIGSISEQEINNCIKS